MTYRNHDGGGAQFMKTVSGEGLEADPYVPASSDVGIESVIETSARGGKGLAVFIQDQTTGVLGIPFLLTLTTPTLAADTVVGSNDITLTAGHGLTTGANAGQHIEVADDADGSVFMQSRILTVTGDVVTLDAPANAVYTPAGSTMVHSTSLMHTASGSIGSPVVYAIAPLPSQLGDMTRVIFEIRDSFDMDFSTFGGQTVLTNGCVLRVNNGDGTYRNLLNFKDNGDIIRQCFDHAFLQPKGGNSVNSFVSRLTWAGQSKHGVTIRLDGSLGEKLELVIQDDLTVVDFFIMKCQGSEIQP